MGGLIPAHAGKTHHPDRVGNERWAHPRSRGENHCILIVGLCIVGSSPLTRGKHTTLTGWVTSVGLIPAHAGKTFRQDTRLDDSRAHPRSRGENGHEEIMAIPGLGSSPLTRGKPSRRALLRSFLGLIPAHAGKTGVIPANTVPDWAHPRSRGENGARAAHARRPGGSSPLTRGKRCPATALWRDRRLIPAHAGKTFVIWRMSTREWAHPRSRGENSATARAMSYTRGSSPLTRGKHKALSRRGVVGGLIPAHAGKT